MVVLSLSSGVTVSGGSEVAEESVVVSSLGLSVVVGETVGASVELSELAF